MIKIIDLFAGIGGIRLAFEKAVNTNEKIKCVFTSEIDKYAVQTYQTNFGSEFVHGDITKIESEDIPDHDILLAGFPCQPFSQAGLKKGFDDTRGTLFFDIERILLAKRPKAFLLENVKQLVAHNQKRTFQTIIQSLKKAGYNTSHRILKARDFGLPQNRERIYIVGFLDHSIDFSFPDTVNKETCVGNILEKQIDEKYTISDRLWEGHQRRKKEHERKGNGFGYSLFYPDSPYTNTMSARYYKDGSEILIYQKNKNPRKLTPRECARLQGFPDSFKIPVSDNQAYKQFGNSVPVSVVKAIANNILKSIKLEKPSLRITKNKEYINEQLALF
jgi:DNA (cytosine-5)-methyltransferase 1